MAGDCCDVLEKKEKIVIKAGNSKKKFNSLILFEI